MSNNLFSQSISREIKNTTFETPPQQTSTNFSQS